MKKIVIIGGGIAGLAAAYRVQEAILAGRGPIECKVLEGSDHFGGKIDTEHHEGFVIDRGPDSFISQKPWAMELCRKVGLADHLIGTKTDCPKTYVYLNKKLVTMPDGLSLMVPTQFLPFVFTSLFSIPGKIRMGLDLIIPGKADDADESLASFVRRRLGEEALNRMAQPMLAGIYGSDPERMSIKSTFPMFVHAEKKYRSLILGMVAGKRRQLIAALKNKDNSAPPSLFMTLKNGLGEMVAAVIEKSPDITFSKNSRVERFGRCEGGAGWSIGLDSGESLEADAVILTTPAFITADLLVYTAPRLAKLLEEIPYVSTAVATLGFRKEGFSHPLNGFGFVVPQTEGRKINACTWVSSKFPFRAPEGHVMIRVFIGGALNEPLAEQTEADIGAMVRQELREMMGIYEEPLFCKVFKNHKANVQYYVNHQERVAEIDQELAGQPGLYLAGSAFKGIGIPDCVLNGTQTAEAVLEFIGI